MIIKYTEVATGDVEFVSVKECSYRTPPVAASDMGKDTSDTWQELLDTRFYNERLVDLLLYTVSCVHANCISTNL